MRIEELRLVRFKGFRDFVLHPSQFNALVGLNNGGKTTVLQAIQLLYDLFRFAFGNRDDRPVFTDIRWQSNPNSGLVKLGSPDPDSVWLLKQTEDPCEILATLTDGVKVHLEIVRPNSYRLDVITKTGPLREAGRSVESPEDRRLIEQIHELQVTLVPPVSTLSPSESYKHWSEVKPLLDGGRASECLRARLFWLHERGDKEQFSEVMEFIEKFLPGVRMLEPGLTSPPGGAANFQIRYEEHGIQLDIALSGGGLRTLVTLASFLAFSQSRCLLLDEPDAHLHSSLQRRVAQMLADYAMTNNVQVFLATHSPDFIAELPIDSLLWIDRSEKEAHPCDDVGRVLVNLGAMTNADAIRTRGCDKVLFVEGRFDQAALSALYQESGFRNPFKDELVRVVRLPSGKGDAKHVGNFARFLPSALSVDMRVACITDNDYGFWKEDAREDSDALQLLLVRKEIENYFLDPQILHRAGQSALADRRQHTESAPEGPSLDDVTEKLEEIASGKDIVQLVKCQIVPLYRDTLCPSLDDSTKYKEGEEWFESQWAEMEWRLRNCPGKTVLACMKKWFQDEYGISLSRGRLVTALREIGGCPDDVKALAAKLESHFYGQGDTEVD